MTLFRRVHNLETAVRNTPTPDLFGVVVAVLVGSPEVGDRLVGLYRDGPAGSTAGVFVYGPAGGEPEVPVD